MLEWSASVGLLEREILDTGRPIQSDAQFLADIRPISDISIGLGQPLFYTIQLKNKLGRKKI